MPAPGPLRPGEEEGKTKIEPEQEGGQGLRWEAVRTGSRLPGQEAAFSETWTSLGTSVINIHSWGPP